MRMLVQGRVGLHYVLRILGSNNEGGGGCVVYALRWFVVVGWLVGRVLGMVGEVATRCSSRCNWYTRTLKARASEQQT